MQPESLVGERDLGCGMEFALLETVMGKKLTKISGFIAALGLAATFFAANSAFAEDGNPFTPIRPGQRAMPDAVAQAALITQYLGTPTNVSEASRVATNPQVAPLQLASYEVDVPAKKAESVQNNLVKALDAPVVAATSEKFDVKSACYLATDLVERAKRIPDDLLQAIALTESGRYDKSIKKSYPWPWTVTSGGKSNYFDNKTAAIAHVEKLKQQGVKNIDVGCMQVNLFYHPEAFKNLDIAFNPLINARYAAEYLQKLKDEHGSWETAVRFYHSNSKDKNMAYRDRVFSWRTKLKKWEFDAKNPNRQAKREDKKLEASKSES